MGNFRIENKPIFQLSTFFFPAICNRARFLHYKVKDCYFEVVYVPSYC